MKNIACLVVFCGLLGAGSYAVADPTESQRLRGLGNRIFFVEVGQVKPAPIPFIFNNCYVFESNGDWYETLFPTAGTWMQDSVGAKTSYSVDAAGGFVVQHGDVTPAGGKGVLQLEAVTTVDFLGLEFLSVGYEIDDLADCPFPPPPPPE